MKVIITEAQYNRAIDSFITHMLEPHEEITSEKYPDSIFWVKDGIVIVQIKNSGYLWLDYEIWYRISQMFDLEHRDTKLVIKIWLEQHYDLGELTPGFSGTNRDIQLEQNYDLG